MPYIIYNNSSVSNNDPVAMTLLQQLTTQFNLIGNNKSVYFHKDNNGVLKASAIENNLNLNNIGYSFQYMNGDQIYTSTPIMLAHMIPYTYPFDSLNTYMLNDASLKFWIDTKEYRNISVEKQQLIAKSYNNLELFSSSEPNFTYDGNETIDLSNGQLLTSSSTLASAQYFTICVFVSFSQFEFQNDVVFFEHHNIALKIASNQAPDGTTQWMISLYIYNVFKRGITFEPSHDPNFKYVIFCNHTGILNVNGNISNHGLTFNYFPYGWDAGVLIGGGDSKIKVHEIFYYLNHYDDISYITYDMFYYYFEYKWGGPILQYIDEHNIMRGFEWINDLNHPNWQQQYYKPTQSVINFWSNYCTVSQNGRRVRLQNMPHFSWQIPMFVRNPINVSNSRSNQKKYYIQYKILGSSTNTLGNPLGGPGFYASNYPNYSTWGLIDTSENGDQFNTSFFILFGSQINFQGYQFLSRNPHTIEQHVTNFSNPDLSTDKDFGITIEYNENNVVINHYWDLSPLTNHTLTLPYNSTALTREGDTIMPCVVHFGSEAREYEYVLKEAATIPNNMTYIN